MSGVIPALGGVVEASGCHQTCFPFFPGTEKTFSSLSEVEEPGDQGLVNVSVRVIPLPGLVHRNFPCATLHALSSPTFVWMNMAISEMVKSPTKQSGSLNHHQQENHLLMKNSSSVLIFGERNKLLCLSPCMSGGC